MAPLFQYLHSLLFLLFLFVPSFFVYAFLDTHTHTQLSPTPTNPIFLGRRILSSKSFDDDEDLILPKKKKLAASILDQDDSSIPNKKKKKDTLSSSSYGENKSKKNKSLDDYDDDDEEEKESKSLLKKKKSTSSKDDDDGEIDTTKVVKSKIITSKNQTKPIKTKSSTSSDSNSSTNKTQTKTNKPINDSTSSKNKTKLAKPTTSTSSSSSKSKGIDIDSINKSKMKKSNSISTSTSNKRSSTTLDLSKTTSNTKNNKTKTSETNKKPITTTHQITKSESKTTKNQQHNPPPSSWVYQDNNEDEDLITDFRELPTKFQQTFIPDMQRISTTSRVYLSQASKEITKGFKPYVGTKYASSMTTAISFAFVLIPLLLVSLVFNQIKAYFNLQRLLIFIQIYLAIYFSILCISSLITGLEPLRFFYATSKSTYIWLQLLQTLGYAMYLLLLLMYLVLVYSTNESGLGRKVLGLAQTVVGFAVGLHYYMTVFHRVVLRQPPKTNWKVHGIYAACFMIISLFARLDTRKKAYLEDGGQQGKLN